MLDFGFNEYKGVGDVLLRVVDIVVYLYVCVNFIVYGIIMKYFCCEYMRYIKFIFYC